MSLPSPLLSSPLHLLFLSSYFLLTIPFSSPLLPSPLLFISPFSLPLLLSLRRLSFPLISSSHLRCASRLSLPVAPLLLLCPPLLVSCGLSQSVFSVCVCVCVCVCM